MDNSKKLIVYFTYTNNTKRIAEDIKKKLNCDILEIKPVKPYDTDYDTVVRLEQNNETAKKTSDIEKIDVDLSKYDEIILGSPVWWYTIAPVIRTFLKQNDLSGKKVMPFATNGGWIGRTFKEIEDLCPNSIVENEMNIVFEGNNMQTSKKEVEEWINTL